MQDSNELTLTAVPPNNGTILALDPGNEETAWVRYSLADKKILHFGIDSNMVVLKMLREMPDISPIAVEMIASYGMAVGKTVFETCLWIGRFIEAFKRSCPDHHYRLIYRSEEKMALCHSMKAKDSNIRQAIMDRYGSTKEKAIGNKKLPGPLYGVSSDVWAAIAVAIVASETEGEWRTE